MNVYLAILVYGMMAAILVAGLVAAAKGTFWLLIVGLVGFAAGVTKIGILHH